jgi:SPP1 gp7 family putative phage head morphogenesis protein
MLITTKPKIARAVHANRGIAALYHKRMLALIAEMDASILHWVTSTYRQAPPLLAQDASPVKAMRKQLRELGKRWIKRFDDAAPVIAEAYLKGSFKATDSAMRQALKDAGWTVKFEMTPFVREAYEASLAENIGLIRSIPQQYLQQVEGIAMRAYTAGRDLETMVKSLKRLYPKAANRAALISLDQSNKANSVVTQARQTELGIVEAVWMHSHAGKTPRPTHVAMNGKTYKVAQGMWDSDEKKWIFPGELISCRCTGRSVIPAFAARSPK